MMHPPDTWLIPSESIADPWVIPQGFFFVSHRLWNYRFIAMVELY